jgi:hypothetical protein
VWSCWAASEGHPAGVGYVVGYYLSSAELFGLFRILDDPEVPTGTGRLGFHGILARSGPEKARLHRECGRAAIWYHV